MTIHLEFDSLFAFRHAEPDLARHLKLGLTKQVELQENIRTLSNKSCALHPKRSLKRI